MSVPQYEWRTLSAKQRSELLAFRKERGNPWHSPPHVTTSELTRFHITAACFEHRPYIGQSPQRINTFSNSLLELFENRADQMFAWCVLPNHYHLLVETPDLPNLMKALGRLHGRSSYLWNGEDQSRGRQVFFRSADRSMRTDRHFWATLNYVHHNPVHHGYVEHWTDWPWSSAREFLEKSDPSEAKRIWREYPIREYGKGWDDSNL